MQHSTAIQILKFWFGENYITWPDKSTSRKWFMGGDEFDQEILLNFETDIEELLQSELEIPNTAEELVASVIVLDQFTRNIFRGTEKAFSGDGKALQLAKYATKASYYKDLPAHQKIFITMPFEHSEEMEDQLICLDLFEKMLSQYEEPLKTKVKGFQGYADDHYQIIKAFGRYPHRNKILGRTSTQKELDYIKDGKSFGQ
jgi:uncharacterized protein (DUF924 family)